MAIIQTVEEQLARLGSFNRMYNYNRNNWKSDLLTGVFHAADSDGLHVTVARKSETNFDALRMTESLASASARCATAGRELW